ncbi:MAG TPA: 50S ribosomal protein L18Ae [archaeon]|nr:50S ribosomal protein L18Ae [archaeon]
MSNVKIFRIKGEITEPKMRMTFTKELMATKPEDVAEKIYAEIGSRHKIKRHFIQISEIKEIKPEEVEDVTIRKLFGARK